jgi:hypothetical protein
MCCAGAVSIVLFVMGRKAQVCIDTKCVRRQWLYLVLQVIFGVIDFSLWRFAFRVSLGTTLIITGIVDMAPAVLQFGFTVYITHKWRADAVAEVEAIKV